MKAVLVSVVIAVVALPGAAWAAESSNATHALLASSFGAGMGVSSGGIYAVRATCGEHAWSGVSVAGIYAVHHSLIYDAVPEPIAAVLAVGLMAMRGARRRA